MNTTPPQPSTITEERRFRYLRLIDELLQCPSGQEPEVLDAKLDLLDAGLIQTMVHVASLLAHNGNSDGAECLLHIARELAIQLGLYPKLMQS